MRFNVRAFAVLLAAFFLLLLPRAARADAGAPDAGDDAADASAPLPDASEPNDAATPVDAGPTEAASANEDAAAPPAPEPAIVATPVIIAAPVTNAAPASSGGAKDGVGFSIGVRIAYSFPFGVGKDPTNLADVIPGAFIFGGDIGYFINPHLYIGAYAMYGLGVGTNQVDICSSADFSCSSSVIRFGAVADWHFRVTPTVDPWAGLGVGYEILNQTATDQTGAGNDESGSSGGLEVIPRGGIDWKPAPAYGVGPYVEVPVGHYWASSFAVHEWLSFGVRLRAQL